MARILQLIETLGLGGAERMLAISLPLLRDAGFEVTVCTLYETDNAYGEQIEAAEVPVRSLRMRGARDLRRGLRRLRRLVGNVYPDLMHTHLLVPDLYGATVGAVTRIPVVSTKHNVLSGPDGILSQILESSLKRSAILGLERLTHRVGVTRVIAVSRAVRNDAISRLRCDPATVEVIPNGVDPSTLSFDPAARRAARRLWGVGDDTPVLLCLGRLAPEKGQLFLVRAAARVRDVVPDARLVLVGGGDNTTRQQLRREVQRLDLGKQVLFMGNRKNGIRWVHGCDIFVQPSISEGFGLSLLEAMALARASVVSAVGGLTELVEDGVSGILVESGDPDALAEAICDLLASPEDRRRLGASARDRVEDRYDVRLLCQRQTAVYRALLEGS